MHALNPIRVAVLRSPEAPPLSPELFAPAEIEVLDFPLESPSAPEGPLLARLLSPLAQAVVLDVVAGEAELAGTLQAAGSPPVVRVGQAARARNEAMLIALLDHLTTPVAELTLGLLGPQAQELAELLLLRGVGEDNLHRLPPGAAPDSAEESLAPPWPQGLDLLVVSSGESERPHVSLAEVPRLELVSRDDGLVLPYLARAVGDLGRPLPEGSWLAGVAGALAQLARGGDLPIAGDRRLLPALTPAAAAAIDGQLSPEAYRGELLFLRSPLRRALRPVLEATRQHKSTIVFTAGEDARVLFAARRLVDQDLLSPWILGDQFRVEARAKALGVSLKGIRVLDPKRNKRRASYAERILEELGPRQGLTPEQAAQAVGYPVMFAALSVLSGESDGMVVVEAGEGLSALGPAGDLLRLPGARGELSGIHLIAAEGWRVLIADTAANSDPTSEQLAASGCQAAALAESLLGVSTPRVALLGHTNFGQTQDPLTARLERARDVARAWEPGLEVDGPMWAQVALDGDLQEERYPFCALRGEPADVLVGAGRAAAFPLVGTLQALTGAEAVGVLVGGVARAVGVAQADATADSLELLGSAVAAHATWLATEEDGAEGGDKQSGTTAFQVAPPRSPTPMKPLRVPRLLISHPAEAEPPPATDEPSED